MKNKRSVKGKKIYANGSRLQSNAGAPKKWTAGLTNEDIAWRLKRFGQA